MASHLAQSRAHGISPRKEGRIVKRIAAQIPPDLKALWVEQWRDDFEAAFHKRLVEGDVQVLRVFAEMAGAVGSSSTIIVNNLIQRFGASSETELHELVESGRRMRQLSEGEVSPERCLEDGIDLLKAVLRVRPEWKELVFKRLGSEAASGE